MIAMWNYRIFFVTMTLLATHACSGMNGAASDETQSTAPPAENALPSVLLTGEREGDVLTIHAHLTPSATPPRMADIRVQTSERLTLLGSAKGAAVTAAGKDIVVRPIESGYRVVVLSSSNTNSIGAGELFTLRFAAPGSGPTTFTLLADEPVLAPAGAQEGLRFGDPLTL